MRFSNLHTHTVFSDGKNTPEEMARAAYEKNFLSLGFSDHSDTPCDESYCMKTADYPRYADAVRAVRETYAGRMDILLGLELDACSGGRPDGFDYVIGSVHYLIAPDGECHPIDHTKEQQQHCVDTLCAHDRVEMAKRYYDLLAEHCLRTKPDVVGHFDVLTKFGLFDPDMPHYDAYLAVAEEAMDAILREVRIFEMNTGAIARKKRSLPYPAAPLLARLADRGGEITLTSDAHSAGAIDCFFSESADLLRASGFTRTVALTASGWLRQAL